MLSTPSKRLAELDLLRLVAVLAGMAYGWLGVDARVWAMRPTELFGPGALLGEHVARLFFVISGFLVLESLRGRGAREFLLARLARIYPAYWVSVAAVALGAFLPGWIRLGPPLGIGEWAANLTLFQSVLGVPHAQPIYWALWAELRFFLLAAVLAAAGATYRRTVVFMSVWLAASLFAHKDEAVLQALFLREEAPYFLAGMAFALIRRHGPAIVPWGFAGVGWALAVYYAVRPEMRPGGSTPLLVVAAVTAVFALPALAAAGVFRIRERPWLTGLAELAYPLFLFHQVTAMALIPVLRRHLTPWAVVAVALAVSVALAYLVRHLVERPAVRLTRRRVATRAAAVKGA
ncbi:acyltransferase family protein [Bailinhaonella thermotolerans]|uniref:Acyltransferase n=1 Tax=Bailinhaonella thermotolerans TaxID=1070861 RepID=A0A3A4A3D7_9ACTN|nr:acyltransferase [Bailinhaonella thermotolerans]RJL22094.1 acyltransferase [Bailinhaonella thermotolerans]